MADWIAEAKRRAEREMREFNEHMNRIIGYESALTPDEARKIGERLDEEFGDD